MTNEDSDLADEGTNQPTQKVIAVPDINDILKNPLKLIEYQYESFINDKEKEMVKVLNDANDAMKDWQVIADDGAFRDFPSVKRGKVIIKELQKCFWNYKLMFDKADKTITELKNSVEKYYVLKADFAEDSKEEAKVIEKIDEEEIKKGKDFIARCEKLVEGHDKDMAKQIVNEALVCNLLNPKQIPLGIRCKAFLSTIERGNYPKDLKEDILLTYLEAHLCFKEVFGKYPFIWLQLPELITLKEKRIKS